MPPESTACPSCGIDLGPPDDLDFDADLLACAACGHGKFFRVEADERALILHLSGLGLVTEQNVMRGLEQVRRLIVEQGSARIVVDFLGVTYLSSTILARLINLARLAKDAHATLKLSGLRPDVLDIFRIARLESFFRIYPDLRAALDAAG